MTEQVNRPIIMLAALSVSNSNMRLIYFKKDPESDQSDINMMYIF